MGTDEISCLECGRPAGSNNLLSRHLRDVHGIEWSDYVVKHQHGGEWPTCACGCGEGLPWRKGGFRQFIEGHENRGTNNPNHKSRRDIVPPTQPWQPPQLGWHPNPFTGTEENLKTVEEALFLQHCIAAGEPVTHDHGLKVGWDDGAGRVRIYIPPFRRIGSSIIFDLGGFSDVDGNRRWTSIKAWCDQHGFTVILLRHAGEGKFDVVGGHIGRGANRT